ncbi:hypothetical protein OAB94_02710 [Flavobacteriaceae bacterium]|nr:hypothetical protein [Flavobacteriaceae bacterium]
MINPTVWSSFVRSPRVVVDFFNDQLAKNLPWALAALGIGIGGIVCAYFFIKLAEWLTRSNSSKRYLIANQRIQTTRKSSQSIIRFVCMCLAMLSVIFGFWIGASVLGINFWTITLSYGIIVLVLNTAFGGTLRSAGAFLLIASTDKIEQNWYVSVGNVEGTVQAIHILWVELEVFDQESGLIVIHVPTYLFIESIVKRIIKGERLTATRSRNK